MSIISNLVAQYKVQQLAKIAPDLAKVQALEASVQKKIGPFLSAITPAEEQAALQLIFPNQSAANIAGLVAAISDLQAVVAEIKTVMPKIASA